MEYLSIPDWFSLSKYDALKSYTPVDWFFALSDRRSALREVETGTQGIFVEGFLNHLNNPLQFEVITRNPEKHDVFFTSPIQPVRTSFVHVMGQHIIKERGETESEGITNKGPYRDNGGHDRRQCIDDYIYEHAKHGSMRIGYMCYPYDEHYMKVDLSLPNTTLEKAFKKYIRQLKSKGPKAKTPSIGNKLQNLSRYYVLPILDLLIWQETQNHTIKPSEVARLLSVDYDKLNDVYISLAREAISEPFLSDLRSHISINQIHT
ncbi:DUF6387 family protein [Neptuniibacter pectenicola]|uniref:DUF6387 family protein n=1 Tax=Neptuniibacter pectenicola TaxID=1806669 RepID=UPI000AAE6585|nr:DUF6387 family protein [Neptuniibacter pectenicola]